MKAPPSWHPPAASPAPSAKRGRGRPTGTTGKHLPRSLAALAGYEQARAAGMGYTAAIRAACAAVEAAFPGAPVSPTGVKRALEGTHPLWRVKPTEPPATLAPGVKWGTSFSIGEGPRPRPAPRPKVQRLKFGSPDK